MYINIFNLYNLILSHLYVFGKHTLAITLINICQKYNRNSHYLLKYDGITK